MISDEGTTDEEGKDGIEGKCMRWEVEGLVENDKSPSTVIPVVFGESGDAIMGAGMVRRFKWVRVRWDSICAEEVGGGVLDRCSNDDEDKSRGREVGVLFQVGLDKGVKCSPPAPAP